MDYRSQLIALASAYSEARGLSEARIATIIVNSGRFFADIRAGKTCTVDTYLRVQGWFVANWPDGLDWPDGCDRPGTAPRIAERSERAA